MKNAKSTYKRPFIAGMLFLLICMFLGLSLPAQDVTFTASASKSVRVGEQFRLTYTLNTKGSRFDGPAMRDFRVLSGPMSSTNQSYQIINGRVEQSYQQTYTYYVAATREGTFQIPPASVQVNGKTIQSNELTIEVVKGNQTSKSNRSSEAVNPQTGLSSDDVFIKAFVNNKNPYQGEQIIITYRIYTTVPISQIGINKLSSFPGLWYENLMDDNKSLDQQNETIDGKQYVVADLRKFALFPQRSGEIAIEPLEMECIAQVRTQSSNRFRDPFFDSFFDDPFFNRNVKNVPLELLSNEIKLNVKPLPLEVDGIIGGHIGFVNAACHAELPNSTPES
jgi:archaellum component FlaG (FlaF/FlaG flagellin family)